MLNSFAVLAISHLLVLCQGQSTQLKMGWHDEFNTIRQWSPLAVDNKANAEPTPKGAIRLSLGAVPSGWPYEYQWSGVRRSMKVDLARYSYLSAYVSQVEGYAHLDVDVLDVNGKPVKGVRSSTTTGPGVLYVDLSGQLDPATYKLEVRLIVGGPNSGCSATYNWIRFTSTKDGERLKDSPNWGLLQ